MRWQIGIDDCFKRRTLPAKPLQRAASATSSTGSTARQVINDDDDDVGASAPDPSQVTTFVLEVEHLVKLGCDRGKATAALVKYNDVEKALDACLDQVKTFVLLLDEHCLVVRQTFPNRVAADFVCLQATSVEAEATSAAEGEVDKWMVTQEEKPEKKKKEASDGEEAGSAADDADEAGSTVDDADEEEDEDDDDDEEDEEEEEEDEEDEEEDEEDGDEDCDAAKGDDEEEQEPSVLTQEGERAATNPSPPPPKRITRRDAKDAASEVPLSHYHTASQPTLAAHGELWAQNCRSASALQKARNQAKTGQAEKKSEKKPARKPAPARPQPTGGAESKNRIPRKRKA